jgi:ribosomal peptide maturation radical SAM protein 1
MKVCATDNILAMEYFKDLLPRLADQDLDLEMFYEVKANLNREQLRLLRAAGVKNIQPGIESFSSRILKLMRKGTTAIQNIQLLKWCHEYDIWPTWNLMYDFPEERAEDYAGLPELFQLLMHLPPPENICHVIFQRFSPYHFEPEKFGLKLDPWPGYRFIYPEQRVDFDEIAYYFVGHWNRETKPENYIGPVRDVLKTWKKLCHDQSVFCFYEKGPDYLLIHDNRPMEIGTAPRYRRLLLNGPLAAIYLYCDQHHTFKAICKMVEEEFPDRAGGEQIRALLNQLVEQGLMFKEDDQYLSLAVRKKSKLGPI